MNLLAQKKIKIDGDEYTLQRIPFRNFLEINDRCTNKHGVLMKTPYSEELLKHCVISPRVSLSTFDNNVPAGMELVGEVESFLNSKSEPNTNQEESEE